MIGMVAKKMFFDSKAVTTRVDVATQRVFKKFGAYVRTSARSSIRKRKAISKPGSPPSSHVGTLRRLIYFGYDRASRSVVIGPEQFEGRAEGAEALEYGGRIRVKSRKQKTVMATYRARPFMGPAFEKEKPKLPAMWANSVK